ncbi:MAG: aldose 1-epimerase family protein [Oscillospiraceae bacterium]|nr:aldose 1-epimerase family protein [Oscillospiraceae bacterium]
MPVITIKNNELEVKIKTLGAELTSVKDNSGKEYIWCGNPEVWDGQCPNLFPIVSRLRNCEKPNTYVLDGKEYEMGMHGFAKLSEFEVEEKSETSATFLLKSNDFTRAQYPFEFEYRIVYSLLGRKLKIDFITDNKSDCDMYYSAGSHEGFAINGGIENYSAVFDEEETLSKYEVLPSGVIGEVPTPILKGEREIKLNDDHFAVDALIFFDAKSRGIAIRDDRTGEQIHISFPGFDTLLIWKRPGAEYVCVEPWAGAPDLSWKKVDDFSKKYRIRTLAPQEKETLTHTITF